MYNLFAKLDGAHRVKGKTNMRYYSREKSKLLLNKHDFHGSSDITTNKLYKVDSCWI